MPVRNGAKHLTKAVQSLSAQSLSEIEFVIVDDHSQAETSRILAGWASRDPRVRLFTAAAPMGVARALNWGLENCRAPLVARADGDDVYHPERIERQLRAFRADPALGVLSTGFVRIDEHGTVDRRFVPVQGHDLIRFRMLFMNSLLHPGVMFRTDVVRAAGGYDPAFWTAQDSDLWARLGDVTKLDNLAEPLVGYRVHPGSLMRKRGAAGRELSLTVPARLQGAYLGASGHDLAATVDLFQGFRAMQPAEIRRGLVGLRRILEVAQRRERPEVVEDFRATVTASLTKHARRASRHRPASKAELMAQAARWRLRAWIDGGPSGRAKAGSRRGDDGGP